MARSDDKKQEDINSEKAPKYRGWKKYGWANPEAASFYKLILLIFFVRSFIVEPFRIPSGSMIPTLLIGDHIFVAKTAYDIGIPFTQIKLIKVAEPKRGDIVVFDYPNYENSPEKSGYYYIKRLIAVPGDEVKVVAGVPFINGEEIAFENINSSEPRRELPQFKRLGENQVFLEQLPGQKEKHFAQSYPRFRKAFEEGKSYLLSETQKDCLVIGTAIYSSTPRYTGLNEICPFVVPEGQYFVMGDNREDSEDGRSWGFVQRKHLRGRAFMTWFSLLLSDAPGESAPLLRLSRIGHLLK